MEDKFGAQPSGTRISPEVLAGLLTALLRHSGVQLQVSDSLAKAVLTRMPSGSLFVETLPQVEGEPLNAIFLRGRPGLVWAAGREESVAVFETPLAASLLEMLHAVRMDALSGQLKPTLKRVGRMDVRDCEAPAWNIIALADSGQGSACLLTILQVLEEGVEPVLRYVAVAGGEESAAPFINKFGGAWHEGHFCQSLLSKADSA